MLQTQTTQQTNWGNNNKVYYEKQQRECQRLSLSGMLQKEREEKL